MWLLKVFDGSRERRIITNAFNLDLICRTLEDFSFRPRRFIVSEFYDPVSGVKFTLDPETLEVLAFPEDAAVRLRDCGYFEVHPIFVLREAMVR